MVGPSPCPVRSSLDLKLWSGGAKACREGASCCIPDHPVMGSVFQGPEKGSGDSVDAEIPTEDSDQVAQHGPCIG